MAPPIIGLLQAASEGRRDWRLAAFDEAQVCWAVERGLGPLLLYTTACDAAAATTPSRPLLQATHLTAQILSGEQLDAMVDGLIAMLDIINLLRNSKEQLRWELILHWLHGSLAALHLSLILTYLQKYQLIDIAPEILQKLLSSQRCMAGFNLKILQIIIDRYVVEGKDFGLHCTLEDFSHVWVTLLSPGSPIHHLILVIRHFLRLRTRLYSLRRICGRNWQGCFTLI
jgi:hypothetical protein